MAVPSQEYLKTKVLTASREMLTLMLWDGAIRFAEQGKEAIRKKDIEGSYNALIRSQKIITELSKALNREVDPDLCGKLAALYNFIYRRLVQANVDKDEKLVDDALEIMRMQRQTWAMVIEKVAQEKIGELTADKGEDAAAVVAAPVETAGVLPSDLPKVAMPGGKRGAYPAFAVRPAAVSSGLSVSG